MGESESVSVHSLLRREIFPEIDTVVILLTEFHQYFSI